MNKVRTVIAAALLALPLLPSAPAEAAPIIGSAGFVCRVEYDATTGGAGGNHGTIKFSLYSSGGCQGSLLNDFVVYSTGSTVSGPKFREQPMMTTFATLKDAVRDWTRVNVRYESSSRAVSSVLVLAN